MIPGNIPMISANCRKGLRNLKRKRDKTYDITVVIKVLTTAQITAMINVLRSQ